MPSSEPIRPTIVTWVLVLGGTGLLVGYFAPLVLAPEANTGPLIGLFITGPAGALAGLVVGVAFRFAPVSNGARLRACAAAAAVVCAATLYRCLPEPAVHGYVIDARVESCTQPAAELPAALATWEQAVARVTWAAPAAGWKEVATRAVERDPGVVLRMRIQRESAILRQRAPWSRNRLSAEPWHTVDELEPFYAADDGGSCGPYLARGAALYWPAVDPELDPTKPSDPWPPADTRGFLQLQELTSVPPEYAQLLP